MTFPIVSLPPGVLAHVGSFLTDRERNACVVASRELWSVHELSVHHKLSLFVGDDPAKMLMLASTLKHVIALKPRLRTLQISFFGFDDVMPSIAYATVSTVLNDISWTVKVKLLFNDCGPAFVRSLNGCVDPVLTILVVCERQSAPEVDALLRLMGDVFCVRCPYKMFNVISPDAFDRTRNLSINVTNLQWFEEPILDLRDIHAEVELIGEAIACSVQGANKLVTIANISRSRFMVTRLLNSLVSANTKALENVLIVDIFPEIIEDNAWYEITTVLSTTVNYTVQAFHPQVLRFIEHLEGLGVSSIRFLVTSRITHVTARMVCLILSKRYDMWFYGDEYECDDSVDRIASVGDAYAQMTDECRALWCFAKYMD